MGAIGAGVVMLLVALFAFAPIFAVDFFWHLKLGQLIAEGRSIPKVDLFSSVHPERPYVQFQWLWELLAYGAYRLHGLRGVRVFQVLTMTLSFAALGWSTWRLTGSRALTFCFSSVALVLFEDRFQARPSATALGFTAIMLPALLCPSLRDRRGAPALALLFACVWSNIHSGESLLCLLCALALWVGARVEWARGSGTAARSRQDGKLLLAAALGMLISPAFVAGIGDWSRAIGPQLASGNKEWRPSYTMLQSGLSPSTFLVAFGPTLVALIYAAEQLRRRRSWSRGAAAPWPEWLLCAGLLVLAHQAVRNAFLCLVPLCCVLTRLPRPLPGRSQLLASGLGAALLLVAFHDHVIEGYGSIGQAAEVVHDDLAPRAFPEQLTQFMREAAIEGKIINDGRWGGPLIWELWPRCHVFVDTRQDLTVEMWPIFLASQSPRTRRASMDTAFRRWGIELAVFRGPTFPIIVAPPDWVLLFKAGDQELYQHRKGAHMRTNQEKAAAWLRSRVGDEPPDWQEASLATDVGARMWLDAPAQRRVRARAMKLRASVFEHEVVEGLSLESQQLFDAGRYPQAVSMLETLLVRDPGNARAWARYALAAYAIADVGRARLAIEQLKPKISDLTRTQLDRLAVLEQVLASSLPTRSRPE